MKTSFSIFSWLLILVLQACVPDRHPYYIPYGEGTLVRKGEGPRNTIARVIDEKIIFEVHLRADHGTGYTSGMLLTTIFRVPEGVVMKLASGKFVVESESLANPIVVNAREFDSVTLNTGEWLKYKIDAELTGHTATTRFLLSEETRHTWYRISLPIEQHDLSSVTIRFPDIAVNDRTHPIAPLEFRRQVGTFWYSINE
jgi:hypothetical protein